MTDQDPLGAAEFRRLAHQAVDLAADYLEAVPSRPVVQPITTAERAGLLDRELPGRGIAAEALLATVRHDLFPHPMGNGHPRFFGWVNSPPLPVGAVAEMLAATFDPSCAGGDHAAIYLEHAVIRWLGELAGFPTEGGMGLLVSGGSMASLVALAVARQHALEGAGVEVRGDGLQGEGPRLVGYASPEGHSCLRKAVELLGIGSRNLRQIAVDGAGRMRPDALRAALAADREGGLLPGFVAVTAGTVATGAIDPLDELADVCAEAGVWLHVDGAYGGVGRLDPTVASLFSGLERADSLGLDPHKWLSVPVECGAVLLRDGPEMRRAFSLVPAYLWTDPESGELPWFSEYGVQQTRGFRALKLWMVLSNLGREGLRAHVARHNALARTLADLVRDDPDLELVAEPTLSIVCFRYRPAGWTGGDRELDDLNRRLVSAVQRGGTAFLTNAELGGRFVLRACILHYATTATDLRALLEAVRSAGAALA
ncbi:MAG: pyridoxal-dependent decarboxylase [Candidatus Dormiibacterota bacterium]